jgi:hypothetical protein
MSADPWKEWQALMGQFARVANPAAAPATPPWAAGFAPLQGAAERFTQSAQDFVAAAGAGAAAAAAKGFADALREQFAGYRMPWTMPTPTPTTPAPAEGIALGATREQQLRAQRMAAAQARMEDAQRRLQRLWSDALRDAAAAYTAGLKAPAAPPDVEALRRLYDTWIDCAEDAYGRTAHSEEFCRALAEFVNAGSEWRREFQADAEQWAKLIDLPTRSELNSLLQRVKALEAQRAATPAAAPPRTRRSARKPAK